MSVRPHPGEETGSYRPAASNGKNSTRATGGQGMGISDTGGSARRPRRLMRRVLIVLGSLILVGALAFGGLLLVTPSVGNAPALTRAQDRRAPRGLPGPAGPGALRRVAGRDRGSPVLLRARHRPVRGGPGRPPPSCSGTGIQGGATIYQQLAKMLYTGGRSDSAKIEAGAGGPGRQAYWTYSSAADPADVRRCRLLRQQRLRPGRGELRLLRGPARPACPGRRRRCWPAWSRARPWTTR